MAKNTFEIADALARESGLEEKIAKAIVQAVVKLADDKAARLEGRVDTLTWMVGINITLTLLVLGKLLLAH
jgi:hypothetical protein